MEKALGRHHSFIFTIFLGGKEWSLRPHGLYSPWNSPSQNTGVGSLSLLQRIFPNQGLNPGLPHCRQILYQLSHKGSPNTGVGSLSLLQGIFLTQESNQGLLHCRQILHQLSYQGSAGGKHHFHFLDDKPEHVFWSRKVLVG